MDRDQNESFQEFKRWMENTANNAEINSDLSSMKNDFAKILEAFHKNLEFGTGGLRGYIGAGTNRMNIYTVSRASEGLANYIVKHYPAEKRSVAIGYDSRINSRLFAETSARIFTSSGIRTFIFSELSPTPLLSWAVRRLNCSAGIMITASHNPAEYNGYKVYADDGCQITTETAKAIFSEIEAVDYFNTSSLVSFQEGIGAGTISHIKEDVITEFIDEVKKQSLLKNHRQEINSKLSIVYTPLNGTGLKPVTRTLRECGFIDITVVKEQKNPDGHFPTCPRPNPELGEAMELGVNYAKTVHADILVATDPDCDRVGIAVRDSKGQYARLSANETGVLLLDFICKKRKENGNLPENSVFIKTVVTTSLAEEIAQSYGLKTINVPTGFKFIGEQIGLLEMAHREEDFVFAFEESFGYLSGTYVRDKDGVVAAMLICEMAAFYKHSGSNLLEVLESIYAKYGFYLDTLHTFQFEGIKGKQQMDQVMCTLRCLEERLLRGEKSIAGGGSSANALDEIFIGGKRILVIDDFLSGKTFYANGKRENIVDIPQNNMLKLRLEDNCSLVIRPSGTEPKLKIYASVRAENRKRVNEVEKEIVDSFTHYVYDVRMCN